MFEPSSLLAIFVALTLGGILKGATGVGTPMVAVPVMAAFFDVRLAVVIMVIPNLLTNIWQVWRYRAHLLKGIAWPFALGGVIGAALGTALLVSLPVRALSLIMAAVILGYVGLRLARPGFRLSHAGARIWALPAAIAGGVLQGAAGISAPVAGSFLNAMRLDRPVFIATISLFFAGMSMVQIPVLIWAGLMTGQVLALSMLSMLPILVALPLGEALARRMTPQRFDRAILTVLVLLAARLIWSGLAG